MRAAEGLGYALDHRRYVLAAVLAGVAFGAYQLLATGTVYYDPNPTVLVQQSYPSVFPYRTLDILGLDVQATAIQVSPQLTIFVNPEVLTLLVTESLLVAANAALAFLLLDNARCCRTSDGRKKGILASLGSVVPGISMLGCCGGAFLSVLVGLGLGTGGGLALELSDGSPYTLVLSLVPAVIMYANIMWMTPKITPGVIQTLDAARSRS